MLIQVEVEVSTRVVDEATLLRQMMSQNGANTDRINKLSERLQNLQKNLVTEKKSQFEKLELKLKSLHQRFSDNFDNSNKRFNLVKDQMIKIENQIELQKQQREDLMQAKRQELDGLQQKVAMMISEEIKTREEAEFRLRKQIQEKALAVQQEILREAQSSGEIVGTLEKYLEEDIPSLYEGLKVGINEREQTEELMLRQISEEFTNIHQEMVGEKKQREEQEEAMLEMLKEIISKVKEQIGVERNERERTEETLVNLLEETCNKLNSVSTDF